MLSRIATTAMITSRLVYKLSSSCNAGLSKVKVPLFTSSRPLTCSTSKTITIQNDKIDQKSCCNQLLKEHSIPSGLSSTKFLQTTWNRVFMRSIFTQTATVLCSPTINQVSRMKKHMRKKPKKPKRTLGQPHMKGVVLSTFTRKPKKPNSAQRKCVAVRVKNGKRVIAYVPYGGHSLQEHSVVLIQGGRVQDLPGVRYTCVRGVYDLTWNK